MLEFIKAHINFVVTPKTKRPVDRAGRVPVFGFAGHQKNVPKIQGSTGNDGGGKRP